MTPDHLDVLIVGAGLSGIGAGCHLTMKCPGTSFAILEARAASGGTWDLFRYPGVRSDSDMYTLGYAFRPWEEQRAIAPGHSILNYVRETAAAYGVDRKIRYGLKVARASWSSPDAMWMVEALRVADQASLRFTCNFLFMCSGYYDYAEGHAPDFAGRDSFAGRLVHPQHWPADLDYAGKRVVVIGSGATAVTLVPEMAKAAAHVTMLQRSPTYIVSRPAEDRVAQKLRRRLPAKLAYALTRWKNVLFGMYFYSLARRKPARVKEAIIAMARAQLGPHYDVDTHFRPRYNPWDQRLCLVPDADLFDAIRRGTVSVVTDRIEHFTATGLRLASGADLPADIIVTATGLKLLLLGGMSVEVDGARVDFAKTMAYKGMMYSDVPNLASVFGYTNASWTLKADLTCDYVCRLLSYMDRRGYAYCIPRKVDADIVEQPFLDFSSGYVQRAIDRFPRQGSKKPWRLYQNYALDLLMLRFGGLADKSLEFGRRTASTRAA
jgi:cation diffusion facilitator CzcD-associated flavoprotein CzcO